MKDDLADIFEGSFCDEVDAVATVGGAMIVIPELKEDDFGPEGEPPDIVDLQEGPNGEFVVVFDTETELDLDESDSDGTLDDDHGDYGDEGCYQGDVEFQDDPGGDGASDNDGDGGSNESDSDIGDIGGGIDGDGGGMDGGGSGMDEHHDHNNDHDNNHNNNDFNNNDSDGFF